MSINFEIKNLAEAPECYSQVTSLIEKTFNYDKDFKVAIDFYPLLNTQNHPHCYVLLDENKVIGHIGVKYRFFKINNKFHPVAFLGGICIEPSYQGKGYFNFFFTSVLQKSSPVAVYFLWSHLLRLYQNFGFYPAFELLEYELDAQLEFTPQPYEKVQLKKLEEKDFEQIKKLYESQLNKKLHLYRSDTDWKEISEITSASLFIKRNSHQVIDSYFIKNKGQDLTDIVHEYFFQTKDEALHIAQQGKLWLSAADTKRLSEFNPSIYYASVIKIGDIKLYNNFLKALGFQQLEVKSVNNAQQTVDIHFENQDISLPIQDFLNGIWGPGYFPDINREKIPNIYICGLDSI
ncbi:MAG: GNAT family N-acetyltransferase [Halobacteriovoraceae bacterium]|nr:GNAT family N-acetyltransferase [Halobacteriovoraceae bacterium]